MNLLETRTSASSCRSLASGALLRQLPLVFEPNEGQASPEVKFVARGGGYTLSLNGTEAVMAAHGATPVRMRLVGANALINAEELVPTGGVSNCFIGNDPAKWRTNIPHFRRIRFQVIYAGVDEVFFGNAGELEYDLA